jgi:outer membrane protein assembly factor BamD
MKCLQKIIIILCFCSVISCSKEVKDLSIITEKDLDAQMIDAYKEGLEKLEAGNAFLAIKKFNEAELLYPQSVWAPKSLLMSAYSHYLMNDYYETVSELERYFKTYPNDKNKGYATYLMAMSYYNSIVDEKKDFQSILKADETFQLVIKKYPGTDFAVDSKFKLGLIQDIKASKEIYIGRHYIKKEKWIPAINRFKKVVNDYETTIYVEEAIHRLVEIHYKIGLVSEAKKYANLLGYNYGSGEWYKKSYLIFNKEYKNPIKKIKKDNKKSLIKKLNFFTD